MRSRQRWRSAASRCTSSQRIWASRTRAAVPGAADPRLSRVGAQYAARRPRRLQRLAARPLGRARARSPSRAAAASRLVSCAMANRATGSDLDSPDRGVAADPYSRDADSPTRLGSSSRSSGHRDRLISLAPFPSPPRNAWRFVSWRTGKPVNLADDRALSTVVVRVPRPRSSSRKDDPHRANRRTQGPASSRTANRRQSHARVRARPHAETSPSPRSSLSGPSPAPAPDHGGQRRAYGRNA